ncbi:MAG: alpha/beta fold hydrolase [Sphingomonadaceae bacterium]
MALVQVANGPLNVRMWGSGEPLLLVHGLGASSDLWAAQVRPFAQHYEVVAIDVRGFGRSVATQLDFTLDNLVEDVVDLCAVLKFDRVHFLGSSMGGFIGQKLALSAPGLCQSLILCHTGSQNGIPREIIDSRLEAIRGMPMDDFAALVSKQALAEPADPFTLEWLREMIAKNDPDLYAHYLGTVLSDFDVTDRVGEIRAPTLIISGSEDRVIPPRFGVTLHELMPGSRHHLMSGVGHLGYAEKPDEFNSLVLEFLDQLTSC